ncbi:probable 3-ketoacyl-CoA synthase 21 [Alnus glutinosa]|uniref:probable 3-ketoacyl-CoA synthase 21 n=1 Tax=Alnus glutinosa TaxID=3517 RepID=UPI002D7752DD|nr:probable 3-ketoacyl-CoA synthase 21 [Alnus glutinosa]
MAMTPRHVSCLPELVISSTHHLMMVVVAGLVVLYLIYRRKVTIYLLDFACYRPPNSYRLTKSMFVENIFLGDMDADSIAFQIKILEKSGFSEETSVPPSLTRISPRKSLSFAMEEVVMVMCSAVTELFQKTNINPKAIDILISNSSMFCPTPSLSAVVINKFRMRSNVMSFHLSGMGCSAGIIAVDLAKDVLRVHRNSLALIVSTETLLLNWYTGKNPSMLITNCLFRMGGAAVLLSNRKQDKSRAKYELKHLVRTNKAQDDLSHTCVIQDVDSENMVGVSISKNIVNVAGDALKTNIAALGPLVLPFSEQLRYALSIICQKIKWNARRSSTYVPDFKKAFEHFCIHAGGRAVIQAIEKNLGLRKQDVEPSKMTLYKFGNTSSSSIWYELCYIEAKGRMKRGDRVWQIGFGSGFKCNSAVWKCVYNSDFEIANAWSDIYSYPVEVPNVGKIN